MISLKRTESNADSPGGEIERQIGWEGLAGGRLRDGAIGELENCVGVAFSLDRQTGRRWELATQLPNTGESQLGSGFCVNIADKKQHWGSERRRGQERSLPGGWQRVRVGVNTGERH